MDEAGAVLRRDEVRGQHRVAVRAELLALDVVEGGLVPRSLELGAGRRAVHDVALPEDPLGQRAGEDDHLVRAGGRGPHVLDLRPGRDGSVRDQRPRRRRPDEQVVARPDPRAGRRLGYRQPHVHGGIDYVPVAERDLVRAQRRAAARAVGNDLVALVEAAVVPEPAQRPPDRLDVVVGHRHVGVLEVDPVADPLDHPVPVADVPEDGLPAAGVELGDPELLDLLLRGDAELLLDLELDREPVAVPAALARDVVPAHRLVARVDVLEDAAEDVVGAGLAVRGGGSLVEAPQRSALALAHLALEGPRLAPALENLLLEVGKGLLRIDRRIAAHGREIIGLCGRRPAARPVSRRRR